MDYKLLLKDLLEKKKETLLESEPDLASTSIREKKVGYILTKDLIESFEVDPMIGMDGIKP